MMTYADAVRAKIDLMLLAGEALGPGGAEDVARVVCAYLDAASTRLLDMLSAAEAERRISLSN